MSHYGDMMWINLDKKQYLERVHTFSFYSVTAERIYRHCELREHPVDSRTINAMPRTLRDQVGIPNRHLYTRDSDALWEACRENCIIFHACASARLPDSKIASLLWEGRKEGRKKKMPSEAAKERRKEQAQDAQEDVYCCAR